ncbi:hypothetical protein ACHAWF_016326 [Thalassiosira exigua]
MSHKAKSNDAWVADLRHYARTGLWSSGKAPRQNVNNRWPWLQQQKIDQCRMTSAKFSFTPSAARKCTCGYHPKKQDRTSIQVGERPSPSAQRIRGSGTPIAMPGERPSPSAKRIRGNPIAMPGDSLSPSAKRICGTPIAMPGDRPSSSARRSPSTPIPIPGRLPPVDNRVQAVRNPYARKASASAPASAPAPAPAPPPPLSSNRSEPIRRPAPAIAPLLRPPSPRPAPTTPVVAPTHIPKPPDPAEGKSSLAGKIFVKKGNAGADLLCFGPTNGVCIHTNCGGSVAGKSQNLNIRKILTHRLPRYVQSLELRCLKCKRTFQSIDQSYIDSLLLHQRETLGAVIPGKGFGISIELVREQRTGAVASELEQTCRANLRAWYSGARQKWELRRSGLNQQGIASTSDSFPDFAQFEPWVATGKQLLKAFLRDYMTHRVSLRKEMAAYISSTALAMDHQRKVAKTIKRTDGELNEQTCTVVGDGGVVLSYGTTPDTAMHWLDRMFDELKARHESKMPDILFVDCGCCNGKPGGRNEANSMFFCMWKVLDVMHCISRMLRQCNSEHPRKIALSQHLSKAIFTSSQEDIETLERLRREHGLELTQKQKKADRTKFVRRVIASPTSVAAQIYLVIKTHIAQDRIAKKKWLETGESMDDLNSAHVAMPLVTNAFLKECRLQLIHVLNGCVTDRTCMYVHIGEETYRGTNVKLPVYISLRGTSKVEILHSVASLVSSRWRNITSLLWDARMTWRITHYNRRRMRKLNRQNYEDGVAPSEDPYSLVKLADCGDLLFGTEYGRVALKDFNAEQVVAEFEASDDDMGEILSVDDELGGKVDGDSGDTDVDDDISNDPDMPALLQPGVTIPETVDLSNLDEIGDALSRELDWEPTSMSDDLLDDELFAAIDGAGEMDFDFTPDGADNVFANVDSNATTLAESAGMDVEALGPMNLNEYQNVRTNRNVSRRRNLQKTPGAGPPTMNDKMKSVWTDLWAERGARTTKAWYKEVIAGYNKTSHEWNSMAEGERPEEWEPLLPVTWELVKGWTDRMKEQQMGLMRAGVVDRQSSELSSQLESQLNNEGRAASINFDEGLRDSSDLATHAHSAEVSNARAAIERPNLEIVQTLENKKKKQPRKPKPEEEEILKRRAKAEAMMVEHGIEMGTKAAGVRLCQVCFKPYKEKSFNGKSPPHAFLNAKRKGGKVEIFCPYVDSMEIYANHVIERDRLKKEKRKREYERGKTKKKQEAMLKDPPERIYNLYS